MKIMFTPNGWDDYLYWQKNDKTMVKKINELIKEICRDPFHGIGKPEPLKYDLAGLWSRRIDAEHRLVYGVEDSQINILQCRNHY